MRKKLPGTTAIERAAIWVDRSIRSGWRVESALQPERRVEGLPQPNPARVER